MKDEVDNHMSTRETPLHPTRLAEPPYVRDRLIQEIKFFISHLRIKADGGVSAISRRDKPHLVQYVVCADKADVKGAGLVSSGGGSRPCSTISSRDGRGTPLRTTSPGNIEGRSVI